ncbi:hypothetical protein F4820DRAFT_295437 [Hypoxylon rubiginosum]|uniref:Uncharacterized protein n=1 Tax=Hypoxylon rubiginosum TaxID=110542 RepID=A0ACB9Z200_9PEZI|nr:hypothetical protein F4820DRAFT_295437 [Hypoxylon rubiginosum]
MHRRAARMQKYTKNRGCEVGLYPGLTNSNAAYYVYSIGFLMSSLSLFRHANRNPHKILPLLSHALLSSLFLMKVPIGSIAAGLPSQFFRFIIYK